MSENEEKPTFGNITFDMILPMSQTLFISGVAFMRDVYKVHGVHSAKLTYFTATITITVEYIPPWRDDDSVEKFQVRLMKCYDDYIARHVVDPALTP